MPLVSGRCSRATTERPSFLPKSNRPHRNQNVSSTVIKNGPIHFYWIRPFLLSSVRQRTAAEALPSSPHFSLSTPAGSADGGTPAVQPPHQSKASGKEEGRGRKLLLQKGLPPPVSLLHLTSTRHLPSPYAAQANDILLISLGPLDGGRHDAEALKAQTLLAKQQHFIHRLLA